MKELEKLRKRIDSIDREILDALNRRAEVVIEVGRIKRDEKLKFHSPERERKLLEKLARLNKGGFPNEGLRAVYREIMSASLSLEEPLKVAYLGPRATFSHMAAMKHFGSVADFRPCDSVREIFDAVDAGKTDYGIVPIENSTEGVVTHTIDMFSEYDLKVFAEVMINISNNLLSKSGKLRDVKKIYSHSQPIAQCRKWLESKAPGIPVFETASTARAAELAAKNKDCAAIASELAARIYGLAFVERGIEDNRHNMTRFLVISKDQPPKSARSKTSIMFSVKDKPGSLYNVLLPFKKKKINLTKIESRPSKRKAWEYIFFVDMEGHVEDRKIRSVLDEVGRECLFLKILGSYPIGE